MKSIAPYLRIENLWKRFGDFIALENISLNISEGEFVCFLGPSGCGKTTLLRAIAGLDLQSEGQIEQAGRNISNLPPAERDFGIVFQSYALFPNLTVNKNIAYGLENRDFPRSEVNARVNELLKLVGLEDQTSKFPAQLSGGQQQRVALARAIATSPGLLLLDEPLSALDARVRVHLRSEIKALQRALGITTIMVTHDQEEALTMADRIVVMDHGNIEQIGTPEDIYSKPKNEFVANFIGSMNSISGSVIDSGSVQCGHLQFSCPTQIFETGTKVTIAIRPEDINAQDINAKDANVINANILNLEFLGSFYRAELQLSASSKETIYADFSANLIRRKSVKIGDTLAIKLPSDLIQIYKAI